MNDLRIMMIKSRNYELIVKFTVTESTNLFP